MALLGVITILVIMASAIAQHQSANPDPASAPVPDSEVWYDSAG